MEYAEDNVRCGPTLGKFDIERRLLADMKIPLSAEMLANASSAVEISEKAADAPRESDEAISSSGVDIGAFIGGRGALGSAADVDELVEDLKRSLQEKSKKSEALEALVDNWIRVEPWLSERELEELWPTVLAKLPGEPHAISPSRGDLAQGGGY